MTAAESYLSRSAEESMKIGRDLGRELPTGSVLCFFGDLAAGKTTFIKGVALGAAGIDPSHVQSPTFTYLNIYEGTQIIYHFDLYRLRDSDEFLSMGFDEYFDGDGICCIEWSERISSFLSPNTIHVTLEHAGNNQRRIIIKKFPV